MKIGKSDRKWMMKGHASFRVTAVAALWLAAAQAAEWQVGNMAVFSEVKAVQPGAELEPVRIAATRNGWFSGAVAVWSEEPIRGLRAVVEPTGAHGERMPGSESNLNQVRFGVAWDDRSMPGGQDILLETPPEEIPVRDGLARVAVWMTVHVPEKAPAGLYHGQLRLEAEGQPTRTVPVILRVADWVVPDLRDRRVWTEIIQSPDTLALEYDVPLWSERHWELIARSFELIRPTGSRVIYVPLLSRTNQGNEQSMVRWVRGADGSLRPDFRIVERYIDTARKHLGTPKMVVLYAWDTVLIDRETRPTVDSEAAPYTQQQQRLAQKRWDERQKGMMVTVVDAQSGEANSEFLPNYTEPGSRERWQPVYDRLRAILRERGLEETLHLGIITDDAPGKDDTAFLHDVSGGLPWVAHRHPAHLRNRPPPNKGLHGIADVVYEAHVYNIVYQVNPAHGRIYGWQIPELRVFFGRHRIYNGTPLRLRLLPEINITGRQRGVGRVGGDIWPVLRNRRGERAGQVYARYPENNWRNLNIDSWVLAPGPDGPAGTARLQNLVEGLQESEARVYLEQALLDDARRARMGDELATRVQKLLDERQLAMWRTVWADVEQLEKLGTLGDTGNARNAPEAIWRALANAGVSLPADFWSGEAHRLRSENASLGSAWFLESGWQKRNAWLFDLAAEVRERAPAP